LMSAADGQPFSPLAKIVWKGGSFPARRSFYTEKSGEFF